MADQDNHLIQYNREMNKAVRVLLPLLGAPFVLTICAVFTVFFDFFGHDAYVLVSGVLSGDFTRIGDFFGYVALFLITYVCTGALIFGIIYESVFRADQYVTIDGAAMRIDIKKTYPISKDHRLSCSFDDVRYIEQRQGHETLSENGEIWLYLKNEKKPIILTDIFDASECYQEYQRLIKIGLPKKQT